WHAPAERLVDLRLPRGVGEMIIAADDVGHIHVVVVDDDREHVGRGLVGAEQYEVVEVLVLPDHAALDRILDDGLAFGRRFQPDHGLDAGRRLARIAVAPAAVVELRAAFAPRGFAHFREFLGTRVTVIGLAGGEQLFRDLAMPRGAGELRDRFAVPRDAEPSEPVQDRVDGGLGRALAVGVLDAQEHLAAAPARIEPIEQRGARTTDVQKAGRGGRKARDDGFTHVGGRDRRRATTTSGDVPWLLTAAKVRRPNKAGRLDARPRNWQIAGPTAQPTRDRHDGERNLDGSWARFHPRYRRRRSRRQAPQRGRDPVPAGAERLPPHRPRQVDRAQFRHRR